ncbi:cupredoxin domain-containing protein [bacterium AH-315-E10]|nr:cupredoxin domain-containing protein [bacterium AH-315-E10]
MKIIKTNPLKIILGLVIVSVLIPLSMSNMKQPDPVIVIEVIAKDMKFNQTNPTLYFKPGTRIRLILRNEDPGMLHDLVIESLGIRTPVIKEGEQAIIEFQVTEEGQFNYICSLHPLMMKGIVWVSDQNSNLQTASLK